MVEQRQIARGQGAVVDDLHPSLPNSGIKRLDRQQVSRDIAMTDHAQKKWRGAPHSEPPGVPDGLSLANEELPVAGSFQPPEDTQKQAHSPVLKDMACRSSNIGQMPI
jgi:hypothetical protein